MIHKPEAQAKVTSGFEKAFACASGLSVPANPGLNEHYAPDHGRKVLTTRLSSATRSRSMADRRLPLTHAAPRTATMSGAIQRRDAIDRQSSPPASATSFPACQSRADRETQRSSSSIGQVLSQVSTSTPTMRSVPIACSRRDWTMGARPVRELSEGHADRRACRDHRVDVAPDRPRCLPERSVVRFLDVDDRRTTSERRASFVGPTGRSEQLCHAIGLSQPEGFLGGATPHEPAAGDWLARGSHPIQTGRRCPPGRPESSGG